MSGIPLIYQSLDLSYNTSVIASKQVIIVHDKSDTNLPFMFINNSLISRNNIDINQNPRGILMISFPQSIDDTTIKRVIAQISNRRDILVSGYTAFNIIMIDNTPVDSEGSNENRFKKINFLNNRVNTINENSFNRNDLWLAANHNVNFYRYNIYSTTTSLTINNFGYGSFLFKNMIITFNDYLQIGNKKIVNNNFIKFLPLINPTNNITIRFTEKTANINDIAPKQPNFCSINNGVAYNISSSNWLTETNKTYSVPFRDISSTIIDGEFIKVFITSGDQLYNTFIQGTISSPTIYGGIEPHGILTDPYNPYLYDLSCNIYGFDIGLIENGRLIKQIFTDEKTTVSLSIIADPSELDDASPNPLFPAPFSNKNLRIHGKDISLNIIEEISNPYTKYFNITTSPEGSYLINDGDPNTNIGREINNLIINPISTGTATVKFNTICNSDNTFNLIIPDEIKVTVVGFTTSNNFVLINVASTISYSNSIHISANEVNDPAITDDVLRQLIIGKNPSNPGIAINAINSTTVKPQINTYTYLVKVINNAFWMKLSTSTEEYSRNPTINIKENDQFYFDMSDASNKGKRLTFFTGKTNSNGNIISGYEIFPKIYRDSNNDDYAIYPQLLNPGDDGYIIGLRIPESNTLGNLYYNTLVENTLGEELATFAWGTVNIEKKVKPTFLNSSFQFTTVYPDSGSKINKFSYVPNINNSPDGVLTEGIVDISMEVGRVGNSVQPNQYYKNADIESFQVFLINMPKITQLKSSVINNTQVVLNWDINLNGKKAYNFQTQNEVDYFADVIFTIEREDTENIGTFNIVGTSNTTSFIDTTSEIYRNYKYRVYATATWKNRSVSSETSDALFVFVCELNRFPYGRWNNTSTNKKLYKTLGSPYAERRTVTGNLYPNSMLLSRKQIYSFLSRGQRRPNR